MEVKSLPEMFLVLDNIRSAHNVGSIFRTADAAGISKIYLCGITPRPDASGSAARRAISKTALGAESYIPWEYHSQTWRLISHLKARGVYIISLEQSKYAVPYDKVKPHFPAALVVGNEIKGVSRSIIKRSDLVIFIPMLGQKESLNVAVATGIALFELNKKRLASSFSRV